MPKTYRGELMEIDRPLLDLFRSLGGPLSLRPVYRDEFAFLPAVDVFDRNGDYVVRLELPGIDPAKDVQVTFEEGELLVKGERKEESEVKEKGYYRHESTYGTFERHIPVPEGVQESDIRAEYKDGVLEISVPRAKPSPKPAAKAIPVKAPKA